MAAVVDSDSNRNKYQESSGGGGGKGEPVGKADNLTAICERTVYKMWGPRRLTTLWASTACYRGSFTYFFFTLQYSLSLRPNAFLMEEIIEKCMYVRGGP
jgi:hypothetical protein